MGLWLDRSSGNETLLAVATCIWEATNNLLECVHILRITWMRRD